MKPLGSEGMMADITLTSTYHIEVCIECGMTFAVPEEYYKNKKNNHDSFFCPEGHEQYYSGKSNCELLREHNQNLITERNKAKVEIHRLENSNRALKAHLTRKKNKIKEMEVRA